MIPQATWMFAVIAAWVNNWRLDRGPLAFMNKKQDAHDTHCGLNVESIT